MSRTDFTKPARRFAGLLTGLLFASSMIPLPAHAVTTTRPGQGFGAVYDAAHETTVNGTIQAVVTKHEPGSPAGMHLLVAGPQGIVDTHIGSQLSKENKQVLQSGASVQIVGSMLALHGKQYLLARQISVGGRTIMVRNARGFLVFPQVHRIVKTKAAAQAEPNGGAR